jgi:hypothetical protein
MNKRLIAYALLLFIFLVPFRYAVLMQATNNMVSLFCFLATVIGLLIFWALTFTEGHDDGN